MEQRDSSSPETFLGFDTEQIQSKKLPLLGESSSLRVSQPRMSKSKASLVWKKGGTLSEDIRNESDFEYKEINDDEETVSTPRRKKHSKKVRESIDSESSEEFSSAKKSKKINQKMENNGNVGDNTDHVTSEDEEDQSQDCDWTATTTSLGSQTKRRKKKRVKKNSNTNGFKCDQCGRKYKYLRGMRQHQKLECNKEPQFPCPYCPTRYRYRQNIREHVRNFHELAFPKWYATHYVAPMFV